jgi:hypothetical protein
VSRIRAYFSRPLCAPVTVDDFGIRPTSFKVFVTISDDHISSSCSVGGANKTFNDGNNVTTAATTADAFDAELLALSPAQFGTAAKRNYMLHAIAGFNWFDTADKTKAYPPSVCPAGYTPGAGGAGTDFGQVASAAACAANKFYIESNTIKLCPATCGTVQADPKAAIKVLFGCAPKGAN